MSALVAARAVGLLADFSTAGVLALADAHVALRLGALVNENDDRVLLAAALTVRGTRHGSVVLDLAEAATQVVADPDDADIDTAADGLAVGVTETVELPWPELEPWVAAVAASPLVTGAAGGPPLQMVGSRLWLDRYWRQEVQVATDLLRRSADRPGDLDLDAFRTDLDELFPETVSADQRTAVAVAALSRVAVIAGGPGTGKTTTVAQLIAVLRRGLGPGIRIALAAPTGKAAARLEEAVHSATGALSPEDRAGLAQLPASTLHRLLGWRPGSTSRFRHNLHNHLPYDVVVVDESSMLSLTLMARLLEALAPSTRLILVGDPDQLASVEAGAVLGDLVDPADIGPVTEQFRSDLGRVVDDLATETRPDAQGARLAESVRLLRTVHRFDAGGPIAELAAFIRAGDADGALELLRDSDTASIGFHEVADDARITGDPLAAIEAAVTSHERAVMAAARAGEIDAALTASDEHRLLCAHRAGPRGVHHWTELAQRWLASELDVTGRADGHYAGQPLLVTSNDYETGLYNGDTGLVVRRNGDTDGEELAAAFRRGGKPTVLPLARLGDVRPMHAMTVHRAQGSQFRDVSLVLPLASSPLATRQTLYTAVTRASQRVLIVGSAESVRACIERPIARATGLRARLESPLKPLSGL
jgi:exodeoxyribonuclease V alpha subunit